jgi:hypothetical protein
MIAAVGSGKKPVAGITVNVVGAMLRQTGNYGGQHVAAGSRGTHDNFIVREHKLPTLLKGLGWIRSQPVYGYVVELVSAMTPVATSWNGKTIDHRVATPPIYTRLVHKVARVHIFVHVNTLNHLGMAVGSVIHVVIFHIFPPLLCFLITSHPTIAFLPIRHGNVTVQDWSYGKVYDQIIETVGKPRLQ